MTRLRPPGRWLLRALVAAAAVGAAPHSVALGGWAVGCNAGAFYTESVPAEAGKQLRDLGRTATVKAIAFAPGGGWAVLYDKNGFFTRNIPDEAYKELGKHADAGEELKCIAFAPGGGWTILYGKNGYFCRNVSDEAYKRLGKLADAGEELKSIAFTPDGGWAILFGKTGYYTRNIPDDAFKKIGERADAGDELKCVAFPPEGGWVVLYGKNGYFAKGIPDSAFDKLGERSKAGDELKTIAFTSGAGLAFGKDDAASEARIRERMAKHKVPGLGVAIIEDYAVSRVKGYGVLEAGGDKPVGAHTPFQAASISKSVTALAALQLVENGDLALDDAVNDKLRSWKVPANDFTRKKPVTLRLLLSHRAGVNIHGFGGYAEGDPVPSLLQVLQGKKPANTPAIEVVELPGSKTMYSGGGYCIAQQLLIDVSGKRFPELMEERVLRPVQMRDSTFQQPAPKEVAAAAAVGHSGGKVLPGKFHTYPEMAAAGLWTTPADLGRFACALMKARRDEKGSVLSADLAKEMMTNQGDNYGLGVGVGGEGRSFSFSHGGSNEGYRAFYIGFPATGQGAVVMTNADEGQGLIDEVVQSLRVEFNWP